MTTVIEPYLNSLSEDILILNVSGMHITSLPDLTRFKNLKILYCYNNQLTALPTLPHNLKQIHCYNNKLTALPTLPQNLQELYCSHNQLTSFPTLPQNLTKIHCFHNKLTYLPTLPENLKILSYSNNPNNPIFKVVDSSSIIKLKQNVQTLNNSRHLNYCLQFKKQFRKWLWEKVRAPKIKKMSHPKYLVENLGEHDDLDTVLHNWDTVLNNWIENNN